MNPFKDKRPYFGQDPFVIPYKHYYLLIESVDEKKIIIKWFDRLDTLRDNKSRIIWESHTEHQVWAPELHQVKGSWYVYYAASDGDNRNHRMYVTDSKTSPFGMYEGKHQIGPDIWGIDLTIFFHHDRLFGAWSGWEKNGDEFPQHLYVAEMPDPRTLGPRVRISSPTFSWENSVAAINEGPQAVHSPDGRLFLTYSANASWTQDYCVGTLELTGNDPLDPNHWTKHPKPLLMNAGHGCFVDGLYVHHRKLSTLAGWSDREVCLTPFSWESGTLNLKQRSPRI